MLLDHVADVKVEFAFGVNAVGGDYFVLDDPVRGVLDNATYLLAPDTVWVDAGTVGVGVASVEIRRGRERELDQYNAGVATIVLKDKDRSWDPANTAGPYYGELTPMRKVRITWNGISLFAGWTEDWRVDYAPGDTLSLVTVTCVDSFAVLANQELDTIAAAHTGDTSGERVDRVLDLDEVSFGPARSIDTGHSTLGDTTFGENALTYLQRCARAEAGYLFPDAYDVLRFVNRQAVLNTSSLAVVVDGHSATTGIPYTHLEQSFARDLLYNRVTGASETTGVAQEVNDTDSQDAYRMSTLALGTLLNSTDAEVLDLLNWHLNRFSQPELRFTGVSINLGDLTAVQVVTLLSLELTDTITVHRTPLDSGDEIERFSLVDGISHRIDPGAWLTDLNLSNADTRTFLILDDPTFGVLGENRLAF